ncbi:oligosaccharide flippase family protein [Cyanobium sp. FACHB-13342]|nr:oligosaccharide flippase family protein [Cyanobium sp. FACHB-13342]
MPFKRTLLGSTYLGGSQLASISIQALAIPHLTHALGPSGWGLLAFVLLISNYASWICNWGFYLEGTQRVAASRQCRSSLGHILRVGIITQVTLFIAVSTFTFLIFSLFSSLHQYYDLYFCGIGLVLATAITPLWFVNGLEKFGIFALINILPKALSLPLMYLFVNSKSDLRSYLLILSLSAIVSAVLLLWSLRPFLFETYERRPQEGFCLSTINTLKNGFPSFSSSIIASLSSGSVFWILPLFLPISSLGYFALVDKIRGYQVTITQPVTAALFPRMCAIASQGSPCDLRIVLFKPFIALMIAASFISSFLFVFSSDVILLFAPSDFLPSSLEPFRIICFAPVFTILLAFITHQVLIPSGRHRQYLNICILQTTILPALLFVLVPLYALPGASLSVLLTEVITALYSVFCVRKIFSSSSAC